MPYSRTRVDFLYRSRNGSQFFFPHSFNAEPRFRISSGEGRELMVEYEFPEGNTKTQLGVKDMREKNWLPFPGSTKEKKQSKVSEKVSLIDEFSAADGGFFQALR